MKKAVLVFSLLTIISCNKDDEVIYEVVPNARVVSVGIDCGDSYLIQFIDDFTELPQTINNTYYDSGWDYSYHHNLFDNILNIYLDVNNVVNHINAYTQGYGFVTGPINYIESHDENRLIYQSTEFQNHSLIDAYKRSMLGASILFTSHGVPMIYNGQEFAQNAPGRDSFGYPIPQPLQWDNLDDENIISLNNHYKNLISLRNNYDVLKEPPLEVKYANNNNHVLAYWRVDSDEEIIVIINFDTVSHTIDIEFPHSGIWHEYLSDTQIDINSNWYGGYTLEPLSSYIFSLVNHILNDTEINFCSGDLNGDGIINVIDIISLVNIIMS